MVASNNSKDLGNLERQYDAAVARSEREEGDQRNRILSYVAVAVSVLAAAFTAWQGYEARQARQDAKEASKQAQEDARVTMRLQGEHSKQAIEMARRSADAAIESNRLSMKALAASQAANVTVMEFDLGRDLTPGKNVEAQALIWNRGNVPAETTLILGLLDPIRFQHLGGFETLDILVGDRLHLQDPTLPGSAGLPIPFRGPMHIVLPPVVVTTQSISTEPLLDEAEVGFVKQGTSAIYVVAFIEYGDGFGKTVRRGFCGVYDGRTPRAFNFCTGFSFRFDKTAFKEPPLGVSVEKALP